MFREQSDSAQHMIPMELKIVATSSQLDPVEGRSVSCDLGLAEATNGLLTARRVKVGLDRKIASVTSEADCRFSLLYVLAGTLTIPSEEGAILLRAHDAVSQYLFGEASVADFSEDLEFFEFQIKDCERGRQLLPVIPGRMVSQDSPAVHILGTGPRSFFDYRDLGLAAPTAGLLEVQIIRAQRAREGGTGWHDHDMAQLSYGLSGWASLGVEGVEGEVMQAAGDAFSIPAHLRHNAASFSKDYWALQIQLPADYRTEAREAP